MHCFLFVRTLPYKALLLHVPAAKFPSRRGYDAETTLARTITKGCDQLNKILRTDATTRETHY